MKTKERDEEGGWGKLEVILSIPQKKKRGLTFTFFVGVVLLLLLTSLNICFTFYCVHDFGSWLRMFVAFIFPVFWNLE